MEIKELKEISKNRKIMFVDNNLSTTLRYVIKRVMYDYKGIPVEIDDIYYQFLYKTPDYIDKFNEESGVSFKTYLGIKCRFFSRNLCKEYSSKKHKVMNTYVGVDKVSEASLMQDSVIINIPMNIAKLSNDELEVYKHYFLEDNTIRWLVDNKKYSRRKIDRLIDNIKIKLLSQLEIN